MSGVKYCKQHKFITYSDLEFSTHLSQFKHYTVGGQADCANCKEKIPSHLVPIHTLGEPLTILCDRCKEKLKVGLETIGYQKGDSLVKFKQ